MGLRKFSPRISLQAVGHTARLGRVWDRIWGLPAPALYQRCLWWRRWRPASGHMIPRGKSRRKHSKERLRARLPPAPQQVEAELLLPSIQVGSSSSCCQLTPPCSFPGCCTWWLDKEQPCPTLDQRHFVAPLSHSKGNLEAGALLRSAFPGSYAARQQDHPIFTWHSLT